jgi:tetratricopeptide (TPR) repeat protein
MSVRIPLLSAVGLLAASCLGPRFPTIPLTGWHVVETNGVRIVAESSADELAARAAELAAFDAAFSHLIGTQNESHEPTTILLVRHPKLARQLSLGRGIAGWATTTLDGSFATVLSRGHPVETRQILLHEYTHLRLGRYRRHPLPRWYNEGLAEYFSTLGIRDGALVLGAVPMGRLRWVTQRRPVPIEWLVSGSRRIDSGDFYATSWLLAHYLLASPQGRGELSRFEKELALGAAVDAARESAFARPFDALDEEVSTHLGYLVRGVAAESVLDARVIPIVEPSTPARLAPGEVARVFGELTLALLDELPEDDRDLGIARHLLETEVGERGSARARALLAHVRALDGDEEGAAAAIAGALRDAPGDREVRLRAGDVARIAGRNDDSRRHFELVLASDETSAPSWFGLGRAFVAGGESDAALDAFLRARDLAWSPALDLELGRLHLDAGRDAEALELLRPLAHAPHRGSAGDEAAELLREAGLDGGSADEKP